MNIDELTIEILKDIRTEIRSTNGRIEGTNERLETLGEGLSRRIDETNARLEGMGEGLGRRIELLTEGQIRLATEVAGVALGVRELSKLLREDRALRAKVDDHDRRISALEARTQ